MEETTTNWKDYHFSFITQIINRLRMKRMVALFTDLKEAESDLFLEAYPFRSEEGTGSYFQRDPRLTTFLVWESFKNDPDTPNIQEWWDNECRDIDLSEALKIIENEG